ncbi:MAG: potassium channel family protein, partial [Anaerolineaceae bacterium]|nr:potassium channel family protein [Anaerolineaceae bacterium]
WGFAYLYMVCQIWIPNSFASSMILYRPLTFIEYLSLSFTNLTATGLGDILPMNPAGRILVMLTQFTGVGYVAMVVSRLISMSTQKRIAKFH